MNKETQTDSPVKPTKIVRLTSENIKRLQAVEISPAGNVVVIGGKNGAGKSSVLDSIEFALGGDPSAKMPVRRGEEKARIVVDLGDIIVRRTFTAAGGTTLVVTNADGAKQNTPQSILDKLVGKLTFDPLAFSREKPSQQAEIMRGLVGLDFTKEDEASKVIYDQRTNLNRQAKELQARIASAPKHDCVPDKEQSTAEILAEQVKTVAHNQRVVQSREAIAAFSNTILRLENGITEFKAEAGRIQKKIAANELAIAAAKQDSAVAEKASKGLEEKPFDGFRTQLKQVESDNAKVRANQLRAKLVADFKRIADEVETLNDKLTAADSAKRKAITEAKYPIEGLIFDAAGGITLRGIPFEQCSSAEQLRVSVAVGLALNPTLRVLLIRDGSLLDNDSMKALVDMANTADAQVWIERVGEDATTSVVIEDGAIRTEGKEAA